MRFNGNSVSGLFFGGHPVFAYLVSWTSVVKKRQKPLYRAVLVIWHFSACYFCRYRSGSTYDIGLAERTASEM